MGFSNDMINKIEQFKAKEKFIADSNIFYPGIENAEMRPTLSKKINLLADDFEKVIKSENVSDKIYQEKIEIGLNRFKTDYLNLDTEDRERICYYVEELMDIVGLESSNGLLNKFMYDFDLNEK